MKWLLMRLFGKRPYKAGTLYKAHRRRWQPVQPGDAINISMRYGFDQVVWGRW